MLLFIQVTGNAAVYLTANYPVSVKRALAARQNTQAAIC